MNKHIFKIGIKYYGSEDYEYAEVTPHYKELTKKYDKESQQEFFRETIDGDIKLVGTDFDLVANSDLEAELIFEIHTNGVLNYKGAFSKTDCELDYSKKICKLKTTPLDNYTQILEKYDNTYDLIKLAPALTQIDLTKRALMQVYVKGASSISNFIGGIYYETEVNEAIWDEEALYRKYYFSINSSANEFEITTAKQPEVNGLYAGTNAFWQNWNGYVCEAGESEQVQVCDGGICCMETKYKLQIRRFSDDAILYKSIDYAPFKGEADDRYIDSSVEMVNPSDSTDKFTISDAFVYRVWQRLLCAVDSVKNEDETIATYDIPSDDFAYTGTNYKKCIGLDGGMFFCTSRTVDEPTKYGKNDFGKYFTNQFIPSSTGLGRPLPICRNTWANASLWYVYDFWYPYWEEGLRKQYTLKDAYHISAAIKVYLKEMGSTVTHENTSEYSQFLYSASNPLLGTQFEVFLTQKTNVLKGEYDLAAQKAEASLEDLMKMLRDCYRCYWFVEDGKFKIEHISYFMNGGRYSGSPIVQLDLTAETDRFNGKQADFMQSAVKFEKSELAARYEFGWMDDSTELFTGLTVDVLSNYIQKDKTEEITINQFSADIDYMLLNPSDFAEDGFALLCPVYKNGKYVIPIEEFSGLVDDQDDTYSATIQNVYASWLFMIRSYLWDMPASELKSNMLSYLSAKGIKNCMQQEVQFFADSLEPYELITTSLGDGRVDSLEVNIDTNVTKANLLFPPR